MDPQLQVWISDAQKKGYSPQQITNSLRQGGYKDEEISSFMPGSSNQSPQGSQEGWLSNLVGKGTNWLGGQMQGAGQKFQEDFLDPLKIPGKILDDSVSQPTFGSAAQAVGGDVLDILKGVVGEMYNTQQQALQEGNLPNYLRGWIPGIGPQMAGMSKENAGPALVDAASVMSQMKGPDMMKGVLDATVNPVGRAMIRGAFPVDEDLPVKFQRQIKDTIENSQIVPKHGEAVYPEIAKVQALADQGKNALKAVIARHGNDTLFSRDVFDSLYQQVQIYRQIGDTQLANSLADRLSDYIELHTEVPRKLLDEDGNLVDPAKAVGTPTTGKEPSWSYINRALVEDQGQNVPYWQDLKEKVSKIEKEGQATKTGSELLRSGTGKDPFFTMIEKGARKELRGVDPEIDKWNSQISTAVRIREQLEELSKKDPSKILKILPLVAGGATAGLMSGLGAHVGSVPMEFAGGYSSAALLKMITMTALKDPVTMVRVGSQLRDWGYNPFTKGNRVAASLSRPGRFILENSPKLRALQSEQSTQQEK